MIGTDLPPHLAAIVDEFQSMPQRMRLEFLLEFGDTLPELPRLPGPNGWEVVVECLAPIYVRADVEPPRDRTSVVHLFFDAPAQAPTTRGFASVLHHGLAGLVAGQVLAVPADLPDRLGLTEVVSPRRINGMHGMLIRIKGQVQRHIEPPPQEEPGGSAA
jgi:cysteine desulfuration protein SufE